MCLCCYKEHCKYNGSCVVGYVGRVMCLGVVGGPKVWFVGCKLGSLRVCGVCVFCCVGGMVIVWSVFVYIREVGVGCGYMCVVICIYFIDKPW